MIRHFRRFHHLPVMNTCEADCPVCDVIRCIHPHERTIDEIVHELNLASYSQADAVTLPFNSIYHHGFLEILDQGQARNVNITLRMRASSLQSDTQALSRRTDWPRLNSLGLRLELWLDKPLDTETVEVLSALETKIPIERLVLIPTRIHNIASVARSVPSGFWNRLRVFAPLAPEGPSDFLSPDEVSFQLSILERALGFVPSTYDDFDRISRETPGDLNQISQGDVVYKTHSSAQSVRVSVVVSCQSPDTNLRSCLSHLFSQGPTRVAYEVVVVTEFAEDNATSDLVDWVRALSNSRSDLTFSLIRIPRPKGRPELRQEEFNSRHSVRLNVGAMAAEGDHLVFLSSNALVPPGFLEDVFSAHESHDVVQYLPLWMEKSSNASNATLRLPPEAMHERLFGFQPDSSSLALYSGCAWQSIHEHWRHIRSECLSVKTRYFFEVGGFAKAFTDSKFAALHFGWKLSQTNARWAARLFHVYLLAEKDASRPAFEHEARTFYYCTLDPGVHRTYFPLLGHSFFTRKSVLHLSQSALFLPFMAMLRLVHIVATYKTRRQFRPSEMGTRGRLSHLVSIRAMSRGLKTLFSSSRESNGQ